MPSTTSEPLGPSPIWALAHTGNTPSLLRTLAPSPLHSPPPPAMSGHAQLPSLCQGLLSPSIPKEPRETTCYAGFTLREWTQLNAHGVTRLHHAARAHPTKLIGFVETFGLGDDSLGALWCIAGQALQVATVLDYSLRYEEDVVRQGADAHRLGQYRRVLAFVDAANTEQAMAFCKANGSSYWESQEEGATVELK
jgi:hypothetical protein